MKVIPPITITDTKLISSTMPELAPAIWNSGTTYIIEDEVSISGAAGLMSVYRSLVNDNLNNNPAGAPTFWQYRGDVYQEYSGGTTYGLGDKVQNSTTHIVYESLAAGNIGNALTNTTKWLDLGPTNRWAMFDLLRGTQSVTPITQVININAAQRVDSVSILGLVATEVKIEVQTSEGIVYTSITDLNQRESAGWYQYFFGQFITSPSMVKFDLPPLSLATIIITVSNIQGNVKTGAVVLGQAIYIGDVQYGAENDVLNFSTVTRDFAGGVNVMVQRRNVPKTIQNIFLPKGLVNQIRVVRDSLNGTPAVWAGLEDSGNEYFEALLILGFYKRFSINLAYVEHAVISLELEEI